MNIGLQQITVAILIIWFLIFLAGKFQQNRIKRKLLQRVREGFKSAIRENPDLTLDAFYEWLFEDWDNLVKKNALFVLDKNELLPIPAKPSHIKSQMNLTRIWLGSFLQLNGLKLKVTEEQAEAIKEVVNSIPEYRRRELNES